MSNGKTVGELPKNFFSVESGLCDSGPLDFYTPKIIEDITSYEFYEHNKDGSLQGKCVSSLKSDDTLCGTTFLAREVLYCDSTGSAKICIDP